MDGRFEVLIISNGILFLNSFQQMEVSQNIGLPIAFFATFLLVNGFLLGSRSQHSTGLDCQENSMEQDSFL